MLPIDFLPDARRDFDESFAWYAERSQQAALRFISEVEVALDRIVASPMRPSSPDGVHREYPLRKFPFRIVYRVTDERVLIVAVAHAKRRPGYWQSRS